MEYCVGSASDILEGMSIFFTFISSLVSFVLVHLQDVNEIKMPFLLINLALVTFLGQHCANTKV